MTYSIAEKVALAMLIVIVGLCSKTSAQELRVTEVFLKADDARLIGPCPLKVIFNGYIIANGPGTVEYTFTRSDGAIAPTFKMEFEKAGSKSVTTTWTLGDARNLPVYDGWQAIKILSPNQIESSHETGSFAMKCVAIRETFIKESEGSSEVKPAGREGFKEVWSAIPSDSTALKPSDGVAQPNSGNRAEVLGAAENSKHVNPFQTTQVQSELTQRARVTEAFLKADEGRMSGTCPLKVIFHGYITADGPGTVEYTFTRSDGANAPVLKMEFEKAGTQQVTTDWTLGDERILPYYEGWQAIKILATNPIESSHSTGAFAIKCRQGNGGASYPREGSSAEQSTEKISPEVMVAFQRFEQQAAAQAANRQRMLDAERAQFEPAANELVEAVRGSGIDLESYLAASKQFAESPAEKLNQSEVNRTNQKFAQPIHAAIAKAVGSGVGNLMQMPMSGSMAPGYPPGQPDPNNQNGSGNGSGQIAACCETRRFEPPYEGLLTEGDFGARALRPGEIRELFPTVRSGVLTAPHRLETSGRTFTVPASARHISVTMNLGSSWSIGLSGLGYAHVWLGLDMNVTTSGTVVCSAPHLEQDNRWTWAGGILTPFSNRAPNFTRTCTFDRRPGDPTTYSANVFASVDGTFFGASGGRGEYKVDLGPVDVTYCP